MYNFQLQDKATLLTAERKKVSHVAIVLYQIYSALCFFFYVIVFVTAFKGVIFNQK